MFSFWSFWPTISDEPGRTFRKKVPLGVLLKSTRRSHTRRFWFQICNRAEVKFECWGCHRLVVAKRRPRAHRHKATTGCFQHRACFEATSLRRREATTILRRREATTTTAVASSRSDDFHRLVVTKRRHNRLVVAKRRHRRLVVAKRRHRRLVVAKRQPSRRREATSISRRRETATMTTIVARRRVRLPSPSCLREATTTRLVVAK